MIDSTEGKSVRSEDEINLSELFFIIWQRKFFIVSLSLAFAVSSVFYALSLPNVYISDLVL